MTRIEERERERSSNFTYRAWIYIVDFWLLFHHHSALERKTVFGDDDQMVKIIDIDELTVFALLGRQQEKKT